MNRILCVANWSEGRNPETLTAMSQALRAARCVVHFDVADFDHNRVVTAFSGQPHQVRETLFAVAAGAFARIDMSKHAGVHPRIGALDVCPFIPLDGPVDPDFAPSIAEEIAGAYDLPIFLYEHSETGKHAADLPSLRRGQFEGLHGRELDPDHGPKTANSRLGATILGVRDWLVAMNLNLRIADLAIASTVAREIRRVRDSGDPRLRGVRALGFSLASRRMSQISMNLTEPDETSPDQIVKWIEERTGLGEAELIGVIRPQDLPKARRLAVRDEQIVR
ncbi:MAG: glutamate formimidoyltransferase [Fimbriimonadales bacterium]